MRYLALTKYLNLPHTPPAAELWTALADLANQPAAAKLLDTQGLQPSATGSRVTIRDGNVTTSDGPFDQHQELAAYALYEAPTKQDVIDATNRFFDVHRQWWPGWEAEADIFQVFEPDDYHRDSQ